MKPFSSTKIFQLLLVMTIIIVVSKGNSLHTDAFGQEFEDNNRYDIVILNQIYLSKFFVDEIVGEILNNGTATIKAVEMTAIFSDDQDDIIGTADSGTSPYTINPGDTASFTIKIFDEAIKVNASSYDFTAKWKDEYLASSYFTRLTGGEISDDNSNGENDDPDDDDDDN
ncbi:MAG TPA: FxLYD domain-containing protein [Candidatus Saccharimonadales bacterium]|nr:FxLYD domain-containing protein [Candidatus Saccharimonadales bacterium]